MKSICIAAMLAAALRFLYRAPPRPTPAPTAASSTTPIATPTTIWSRMCRRRRAIPASSCSPTRRSRTPPCTRTCSSRSPTHLAQVPGQEGRLSTRCSRMRPRSRRCARAGCTSPDSRPGRSASRSIMAGAVPFAAKGTEKEFQGYNLIVIVKASSPVPEAVRSQGQEGRAHRRRRRTPGNLAPMALFPEQGLKPGQGLQDHLLRQARQVGARRRTPATTTPAPSRPTCSTAWPRAAR